MTAPEASGLGAECRTFARCIAAVEAPIEIVRRYEEAHARGVVRGATRATRFDCWLVGIARSGRLGFHLADGHSALWRRTGLFRRKLVLLLALLETAPGVHRQVLSGSATSAGSAVLRLLGHGLAGGLALILGTVLLWPLRIVAALAPEPSR
jgi:hypothetical protein